jgi:HK97 family phage portal protein
MRPIPAYEDYLVGYMYRSPDGEEVPLSLDEVIQLRMPNPLDPYRGMGPVQTILMDLDSDRYSAEWNRNFFLNSAEPGGIIQVDKRLTDDEFDEMQMRWDEQHRGVSRAHRVAILEHGKYVPRAFSQRDMQFAELRGLSQDVIRGAFGIPKFAVGDLEDVNRATAEASKAWFSEQMTVPRLERIKDALNFQYLPLFGSTGKNVEFDYDNPVPPNIDEENSTLAAKTAAYKTLLDAGVDPDDAADYVGIPRMKMAPKPGPVAPTVDETDPVLEGAAA